MSFSHLPSCLEDRLQSQLTSSYDGDSRVPAAAQYLWDPRAQDFPIESLTFRTPAASKNAVDGSFQRFMHSTSIVEGLGDSMNAVDTGMTQDIGSISKHPQGGVLEADERFIQSGWESLKEPERRMALVFDVIHRLLMYFSYSKLRELWLRIIEGEADDDMWLWVDGDEEWLCEQEWKWWIVPNESDWVCAQSALRRRIVQQRYPSVTGSHGKRNERVRNATPEQRVSAIVWLIASSKGVAELCTSHGCTPPTFRTPRIVSILSAIIGKYWDGFPSQTSTWENAVTRSREDGCICSQADCHGLRQWFNMMVWLEGTPPMLEVGYTSCVCCRSSLKSLYKDIVAECTQAVTSHASLLDAFCNYYSDFKLHLAKRLSPTARQLADRKLEPLMKKHGLDMRYLPWINRYPQGLRWHVSQLSCTAVWDTDQSSSAELPDSIFEDARDPWVVLGIIAMIACIDQAVYKDMDMHDLTWHNAFSSLLRAFLKFVDMPVVPGLPSVGIRLCHELDQDYSEERLFSPSGPYEDDFDQDGRQLRLSTAAFVSAITFLWNQDVALYGCRRCQTICMNSFVDTSSAAEFEVAAIGECERVVPPSMSYEPIYGEDDVLGGRRSSPSHGSLGARVQEPTGVEAFTSIHTRLVEELLKLRQYFDSLYLDTFECFQHDPNITSRLIRNARESTLPRRLSGHGTSSSLKLSKSAKVEQIKDKFLEMLRELSLPYERLPWFTLEKDLEKHGCALINWPVGVLRKRGNRGIHDLSAVEVNNLYKAIMCPDETRRLRICRSRSASSAVVASGSKRPVQEPDFPGQPSKRIRFKDMTSKVLQQNLSEHQGDGVTGS
ncbi:hypothetical protein EDC04DRAFT_3143922 [Pisolithus marmoratus]|nr:hypothetical protein EDC04DRAFT_3143922 [Pisolithus marmoratus]